MGQDVKFSRTVALERLIVGVRQDPQELFEKYPIREIREACLAYLKITDSAGIRLDQMVWAEKLLPSMISNNDLLLEDFISWYLFATDSDPKVVRAIIFVISSNLPISQKTKFVYGKLRRYGIHVYDCLPAMKPFLLEALDGVLMSTRHGFYLDPEWTVAERALKIIMMAKDHSWLHYIDRFILLLQRKEIQPSRTEPFYTADQHLVMLRATRKVLLRAMREDRR